MNTIFIDFETYYSTRIKYDLKHISMVEYIHHPEFTVQGVAIKDDTGPTQWFQANEVRAALQHYDWNISRVVAHNVKFDGAILQWKYGYKPLQWVDTKAMVKAVLGGSIASASLKDVAQYLGLSAKGQLNTNNKKKLTIVESQELGVYCKRDVDICHDIFKALMKHIPGKQWELIDWTIRAFLEPQLEINQKKCSQVFDMIVKKKQQLIKQVGIDPKILSSNPQFAKLLEAKGYKVPMKTNKKGKQIPALSVQDKDFLEMSRSSESSLQQLCKARIAVKQTLEETRAKKLSNIAEISPYCFDMVFSGAQQTHRFSGGNGCAGNPQNFRRGSDLRAAIIAPKGKKLIVADFKNIELRILAFISKDPELIEAINNKEDLYCKFASKIYGYLVTNKHKKERMLGKAAVLGLGYGMGWEKFRNTVFALTGDWLSETFAKSVVKLYRDTYNHVPRFWRECDQVLNEISKENPRDIPGVPFLKLKKDAITLASDLDIKYPNLRFTWKRMFGRWRKEWVYDRYKSQRQQIDKTKIYGGMITENICQAVAGDICKEGIQRLIDAGYPPVGQIHDELLVICDEDKVKKVEKIVQKAMTESMPWWKELPLEVEIGYGKNWLEAK